MFHRIADDSEGDLAQAKWLTDFSHAHEKKKHSRLLSVKRNIRGFRATAFKSIHALYTCKSTLSTQPKF